MDVLVTVRRGAASEAFRVAAEEKARSLSKFEPRLLRIELLFEEDAGRVAAEARAFVPGVPPLVARSTEALRRSALDIVIRRMGRQLRKERSKRVDHRAPPLAAAVE